MTTLNIPDEWEAEVLGFADLNTYLRDNIITIDSAISLTNIGYGCSLSTTGAQSIPSTTAYTSVEFGAGSEVWDDDTMHDVTTNNSRITFKKAGRYHVIGKGKLSDNGTDYSKMRIYKNGTDEITEDVKGTASSNDGSIRTLVTGHYAFEVDDYIELQIVHTRIIALDLTDREFTVVRLKYDGT